MFMEMQLFASKFGLVFGGSECTHNEMTYSNVVSCCVWSSLWSVQRRITVNMGNGLCLRIYVKINDIVEFTEA
jgi:hypothetical protein